MFSRYKKKIQSRIDERVNEYCYHDLQAVSMSAIKYKHTAPYNFRCYWNACDFAIRHKNYDVIIGMHRNNKVRHISLHFWVKHKKTGECFDPSIGYMAAHTRYWEIRSVPEGDWDIIDGVFSDGLDYYKEKLTTFWERVILMGDRVV